jgi:hypothetical protein
MPRQKNYSWEHKGAHSILTTIEVAPLQHVNVTVAIDRPRGLRAALIAHLDDCHVYFIDIMGIDQEADGAGEDIGTYLVNCALQALQPLYTKPGEVMLFGTISTGACSGKGMHDPEQAIRKGIRFWQKFGFSFRVFENGSSTQLCGVLSDLHTVRNGWVLGEFPTLVPLGRFSLASAKYSV